MAPKKAKKGKAQFADDSDGEDIKLGDIPEPSAATAKPKGTVGKKAKKPKKKPTPGDWSDDEAPEVQEPVAQDPENLDEASEAPKPVSTFALLQDGSDEEEEEEKQPGKLNDKSTAAAGTDGTADEHDAGGIVCAEIARVSRHPNADRLKICQLNVGSKSVQVVTNAPNVKEGMRTALALEGAQTPGSNITVAAVPVRGSKSIGMICSAFDLGWMEAANGQAVKLPHDMKLGAPLGSSVPEGADFGADGDEELPASQAGKKGGKKKKGKEGKGRSVTSASTAHGLEDEENGHPDMDDDEGPASGTAELVDQQENSDDAAQPHAEQEELGIAKPSKGKKKKGKQGTGSTFAALGLEDEENGTAEAAEHEDAEQEGSPQAKPSKGKKKKGRLDTSSAFAVLGLEDEDNGTAEAAEVDDAGQQDAEEEEVAPGKGKNKNRKLDIGSAFAALGIEDREDGAEDSTEMNGDDAHSEMNGHAEPAEGEPAQEPELDVSKINGKRKQKKKPSTDIDGLLASMGEAPANGNKEPDAAEAEANADEPAASRQKEKKKKRDRKPAGDVDALLAQLEGSAAPQEPELQQPEEAEQLEAPAELGQDAPAASKNDMVKRKNKDKPAKGADEDLDALLAEIGGDSSASKPDQPAEASPAAQEEPEQPAPTSEPAAEESPAAKAGDKKKKKKGKHDKEQADEDLDAILAELDGKPASAQASSTADAAAPAAAEDASAAQAAEDADNTAELSAAAKKKLKKKAKEKAKKAGGAADEPAEAEEEAAGPAAALPKKGGKKVSAAVRRMQEALETQEREAAEAAQQEAERKAAEEEAARKAEEEEGQLAAEREQRKADRAARRAEAKRQGLLLTGKAKKEAERLAALREQLLAKAGVEIASAPSGDAAEKPPPKKVVYGKKKLAKKDIAPADFADKAALEEQAALAECQAAEESAKRAQEEEIRKAAEEAEKVQQEAEAAAAAAEAEAEESDDDMNWEDMDLDAVKLPGTKMEEPPASEAAKRPAEEDKAEKASAATPKKQRQAPEAEAQDKEEEEEEEEGEDEDEEESSEEESEEESSDEESSDEDSSSYEDSSVDSEEEREERLAKQKEVREARIKAATAAGSKEHLRSPICCILGHVDTGKTKLLDNVRRTSVQEGEAGGITQQIGATYVPGEAIAARTESLRKGREFEMKMPGLLIIDTPGHESFTNLRSRGSGLCDIAVLVVDLMHGLEPQTLESIELLKMRKTPFIIALNKVDRLYAWKSTKDAPMKESLDKQSQHTTTEFRDRMKKSMLDMNEQGLNVALYWENPDIRKYVNIVPTSAITGEGIPDLLQLLVKLTQAMMAQRLMFISELQCTVLEVKVIEGLGTTIDVVLVNGVLHEGDQIVVCGLNGAIATNIRSLLTPHPLKELRVKGSYLHHKQITAAQGVKIAAPGLENAVAGTQLLVVGKDDDVSLLKEEVMQDMESIFDSVDRSGEGVCVQASTLGSLEALLEFLRSQKEPIPVSSIAIGPIHRKDVMRAKVMLEKGCKKYGIILAFDVPVTREAQELADKEGVRIMRADIIYHLFDQFTAYCKEVKEREQQDAKLDAVFPCILKILPTCVFNKKDPIVVGADVVEGIAKVGTPLCIPSQGGMDIGRIASMEINHVAVDKAKRGDSIALKVEATNAAESARLYGRHFDHRDDLVSRISRKSINLLKEHFKDDLGKDDWRLVLKLKKVFNID